MDSVSARGGPGLAQDLLDSIFRVTTELVRGERASLLLRDDASADFVMAHAIGITDEVKRHVRVREGEGVVGAVAASKRSVLVRSGVGPARPRDGQSAEQAGRYRTESFLSVPIVVDDESRGVLNVADPVDGRSFEETDLETLELLASHIGACLLQREQGEAMQRLAETDPLTWLFNRRHFDRRLEAELNRALRSEHLIALLMIDVDHFKSINDRFGHRVGDQVLRAVATGIKQAVRLYDVPTRYGGDEFAVILPESDTESASRVALRVFERTAAQALPVELSAAGATIALSIGIATFPRPASDGASLIELADTAMYRAKEAGGGLRVWEHSFAQGPRGSLRTRALSSPPAPYLAEPARLATPELQAVLPRALAAEWNAVVVGREGQVLTVALPDPNSAAVDAISKASGYAVYPVYSNAADLEATRRRLSEAAT
ncbi:MAG TPA: diguanylate cyclase [Candidatus Limnocylindria bacterium]|nr:diguanylate cyclase [Candidatus Limnocylindria bacterium]